MKFKLKPPCLVLLMVGSLSSCAATGPAIKTPDVSLIGVQVDKVSLSGQSFLLGFSVRNPNPFPLPVRAIRYDIRLDEQRFAGGETEKGFVVSAHGDGKFVIGVELDLMHSMSQLVTLLRSGRRQYVDYELHGSLAVDLPFARPIPFSDSGSIRLDAGG